MGDYAKERKYLSTVLGIDYKILNYVLYKQTINKSYTQFQIPKKDGSFRTINAPIDNLKYIQLKLGSFLYNIHLEYLKSNSIKANISHGFEKDKNIISNAEIHRNKRYILNVDIENFFESFHFGRVRGYFENSNQFNYSTELSTLIAQITCYKGKLPQGAPTSPIIANLIFNIVDMRILKLSKKYKLSYTRYADDLTFSTNMKSFKEKSDQFFEELNDIINRSGFRINNKKTRLLYSCSHQEVTGLTVNKKINVNRTFINNTRAMADSLYKTGEFTISGDKGTVNQLEGRFSFINQLDHYNNKKYQPHNNSFKFKNGKLNYRETQYQIFLFYKYFFNPKKPIIVTEGKTDILHLKAALMSMYKDYPSLINKKNDKFEFKITFLNKTKRLSYFLGIFGDGADSMKNIWNFYKGKDGCKNIYDYLFDKEIFHYAHNPVILFFDNEDKKNFPLRKFMNYTDIKIPSGQLNVNLSANLYLQTIPLVNGLKYCEIEDLYGSYANEITIDGKKFNKNSSLDNNKYFGKSILSHYIKKNYEIIDFSNFKPIFNDF